MDEKQIRQFFLNENCDFTMFKMNVPHASHMGGIWDLRLAQLIR